MVSRAWLQAVGVVVLFGFLIMGLLAYRTYIDEPPIPKQVVSESGKVVFTGLEISRGQQVFLGNGLEYGSIFGHGAYLGPDFTADYLHRAAQSVQASYGGSDAAARVIKDFQTNRYDKGSGRLVYTDAQARASPQCRAITPATSVTRRRTRGCGRERSRVPAISTT